MDQQTWQTTAAQLKSEFTQQDLTPLNLDFTGELVVNVMILANYTCVKHVHFAFVLTFISTYSFTGTTPAQQSVTYTTLVDLWTASSTDYEAEECPA